MSGVPWTSWERSVIQRDYRRLGIDKCALLLCRHSRSAIQQQARTLGVARKRNVLTPLVVRVMRELRYTWRLTYDDLCLMFTASWSAVWNAVNGLTWSHVR